MSPYAPKRPCTYPLCKNLVDHGRCPIHRQQADQERGSRQSRGYGVMHGWWRKEVLARNLTCADCGGPGRANDHADHITPLPRPNWWEGDWSIENGQRLHAECHSRKTRREQR